MARRPPPRTKWGEKANEVLADGEWHRFEHVRTEMLKVIQPGVALRKYDTMRKTDLRYRHETLGEKPRGLPEKVSSAHKIERGARRLALESLKKGCFEIKTDGQGIRWIRLRDVAQTPAARPEGCGPADSASR